MLKIGWLILGNYFHIITFFSSYSDLPAKNGNFDILLKMQIFDSQTF